MLHGYCGSEDAVHKSRMSCCRNRLSCPPCLYTTLDVNEVMQTPVRHRMNDTASMDGPAHLLQRRHFIRVFRLLLGNSGLLRIQSMIRGLNRVRSDERTKNSPDS